MRREMEVVTEHCGTPGGEEPRSLRSTPTTAGEHVKPMMSNPSFDVRGNDFETFDMRCECELSGDDACFCDDQELGIYRSLMQYPGLKLDGGQKISRNTIIIPSAQDSSRRYKAC